MKVLITAGSTQVPIDKVRVISNIFKGKTGNNIANHFMESGHDVTLITSSNMECSDNIEKVKYKTYDELYSLIYSVLNLKKYDVVIHSAAISDYSVDGTYTKDENGSLIKIDSSSKISSDHSELFLKMTKTEKIVDNIRKWGFEGKLVKFKLQVDMSDQELINISYDSMLTSDADMIVANCLEWSNKHAYIIDKDNKQQLVTREHLPKKLEEMLTL